MAAEKAISIRKAAGAVQRLRVAEIFYSLQGESRTVGLPTVFVRLTGCPLRCVYCDTEYAFSGGQWMRSEEVRARVAAYSPRYVTVTGGEPLAQAACLELLARLCDREWEVSLETNGAMDISEVDSRVSVVLDLKTPGSGEKDRNLFDNIRHLKKQDQVKFVICDRADYEWARGTIAEYGLTDLCDLLFSPADGKMDPPRLADWILGDRLPVRMQLQLHKLLWNGARGH